MDYSEELRSLLGRPPSILLVEDDPNLAADLISYFEDEDWDIVHAPCIEDAGKLLTENVYDLVLADFFLPDGNSLALFDEIKKRSPLTKVLVMTGVREPDMPIQAFKQGAADFLYKPFDLDELQEHLSQLWDSKKRETEKRKSSTEDSLSIKDIVGESRAIQNVFRLIETVANTNVSVLITGESGTGKELVARALHEGSARTTKPLIAVNCAAIPESLLEDELFGHVPGAYTDAKGSRTGKFEEAHQGTLFLDEIGEMPRFLQVKLLRVLEDGKIHKLGTDRAISVDTRVIAATNADLRDKIEQGEFRTDLFFRLNTVRIHIPPLRERREDVPLLVAHFMEQSCQKFSLEPKEVEPDALRFLMNLPWPGNVRELKNVVEGAVLLSGKREKLEIDDFAAISDAQDLSRKNLPPETVELPDCGLDLNDVLGKLEKDLIRQSLARCGGNKNQAAALLSLKRTTLVAKLRRYGMLHGSA
jgi:DNA-binding NtrC family response regulator